MAFDVESAKRICSECGIAWDDNATEMTLKGVPISMIDFAPPFPLAEKGNMKKYINANALHSLLEEKYKFSSGEMRKAYSSVLDYVCALNSADVESVVRCKDCQHCYYTPECRSGDVILPERYQCEKMLERYREDSDSDFSNYVTPEWFCADGEREKDAKTY